MPRRLGPPRSTRIFRFFDTQYLPETRALPQDNLTLLEIAKDKKEVLSLGKTIFVGSKLPQRDLIMRPMRVILRAVGSVQTQREPLTGGFSLYRQMTSASVGWWPMPKGLSRIVTHIQSAVLLSVS